MRKTLTLYSARSGLEVFPASKVSRGRRTGMVGLRFFELKGGGERIRYRMNPSEAFSLALTIERTIRAKEDGRTTAGYHSFEGKEGSFFTKLVVERFTKNEKTFVALTVVRGEKGKEETRRISVPLSVDDALFLAFFLKNFAYEQSYEELVEEEEDEAFPGREEVVEEEGVEEGGEEEEFPL